MGVSTSSIGVGTKWKFNLHWTTAAGDGGSLEQIRGAKEIEKKVKNSYKINYDAYSYASATSLAILSDDLTGIGAYDDLFIPIVYGVATYNFYQDNRELLGKMWSEAESLLSKQRNENYGFVYELHPKVSGMYKNVRTGLMEQLGPNDIWKIGQTTHGTNRYPKGSYEDKFFEMIPIYYGYTTELLIMEKFHIYSYWQKYGHLPPGNRIFR